MRRKVRENTEKKTKGLDKSNTRTFAEAGDSYFRGEKSCIQTAPWAISAASK